jgi:glycosyltransferase involved in cell wall biosynthesis
VTLSSVHVLHILGELRASGAERMLVLAADAFRALGVTGEVVSTGTRVGAYADALASAGYAVHHVPFRKTPGFFLELWRFARGRFDAIHIHTERASFWLSLMALASGAKAVVKTGHSYFEFAGGLRFRRALQRRLMSLMGVVQVAISRAVRENEQRRFGIETELVYNWFDSDTFNTIEPGFRARARHELGIPSGQFVIALVGNCSEAKNHRALLRAMALLSPAERPFLLHAGDEQDAPGERELANSLGIATDLCFLGPVDDVRRTLAASDAFVMPSLTEGLPLAALEAVASGLPAVLSDVGGLSDFRDYFRGLVFVQPTAHSIAAGLRALRIQPEGERHSNAQYNERVAREAFSIEAGVRAYTRLYQRPRGASAKAG